MLVLLIVGCAVATSTIKFGRRRHIVGHPTILVGSDQVAAELAQVLVRYPQYGLRVFGFVDNARPSDPAINTVPYLATWIT